MELYHCRIHLLQPLFIYFTLDPPLNPDLSTSSSKKKFPNDSALLIGLIDPHGRRMKLMNFH